jgi:hypothetical protein
MRPARLRCLARGLLPLLGSQLRCSRLATLEPAPASKRYCGRILPRVWINLLTVARRHVHDEPAKLVHIMRALA